jgi:hypothetical protein
VGSEEVQILDFKGEVREIRTDHHGPGGWVRANLDELLTLWCLEKHQLGPPRGTVSGNLLQSEDPLVKINGALEVFNAVTGVEEFGDHARRMKPET